jgi:N-methylhydantoinase A/oxoprolinase/acetone carboxylase beta subunit
MRIGISIEKNRVSSVVVNTNGLIIHSEKTHMVGGLTETLKKNIEELVKLRRDEITHVFIGTDFIRTLLQYQSNYTPIGVLRLAGHQPDILMPGFNWDKTLKENVLVGVETLDGGYDYDGQPITPMSEQKVIEAAQRLYDKGAKGMVICGVFSTFYPDQELLAESLVRKHFEVDVLTCHKLGVIGFMERENAGMLNLTFRKTFSDKLREIERVFAELNMSCELFFTQTNGALLSMEDAAAYPFLTIDSALVNAFVGGSKLTQYQDSCAVYMDETHSYAMALKEGTITAHALNNEITSHDFMVPGLHSKGIGLNSVVTIDEYRITIGAPCDNLTAKTTFTLAAAMRTCASISNFDDSIDLMTAYRVIKTAESQLVKFYEKTNSKAVSGPLVLIGPAAALFPQHETVVVAPFSAFASAYGAAMQGITCYMSKTVRLTDRARQLSELCDEMVKRVYDIKGHEAKIVYFDVQPFRYLPEEWAQVTIVVTGSVEPPRVGYPETLKELIASNTFGALVKPISVKRTEVGIAC